MDRTRIVRTLLVLLLTAGLAGAAAAAPAAPDGDPDEDVAVERLRAETERARAEAERARAEAERARAEAEKLRVAAPDVAVAVTAEPEDPGAYLRDGFFLRMAFGPGYTGYRSSGTLAGTGGRGHDLEEDAPGASGIFSIGGIIAPNLALHADLWGDGGPHSDLGDTEVHVENGNVGLGLTHYWMPWNVYVTGAVGFSVTTWHSEDDDDGYATDEYDGAIGVGTYLMVGKEWWVSENWSLGVALRGSYAWTTDTDLTFHHAGAQALFTATFN